MSRLWRKANELILTMSLDAARTGFPSVDENYAKCGVDYNWIRIWNYAFTGGLVQTPPPDLDGKREEPISYWIPKKS